MHSQGELPRQTVRAVIWEIWISALPGSQSEGKARSLVSQRTDRTTNSLDLQEFSFSVSGSKYRLNSDDVEIKHTYCFFKHKHLKKTFVLEKWTNTAVVHGGVSFYCPNRKWRSLYKERSSKSIKNRQFQLAWADFAKMPIPSAQRAITRK